MRRLAAEVYAYVPRSGNLRETSKRAAKVHYRARHECGWHTVPPGYRSAEVAATVAAEHTEGCRDA